MRCAERLLKDKSASVRQNAAWALGRQKQPDNDTVAALCDVLSDPDALVRRDAASALESIGQEVADRKAVRTAAKPLLDLVKGEKDEVVRKTALGALASLAGPEHREYAPDLYHLLDGKDEETARGAAYASWATWAANRHARPAGAEKALASADPMVQALAAVTLANAGEEAADAVDDLARTLTNSKNAVVRRNCCVAIGHLKAHGKPAIPALAETMKSAGGKDRASEEVRELAAEAIAQIRFPYNEAAMDAVRAAIAKDSNQTVRQYCVWATFNVKDLDKYDLVKPLTDVLDEKGGESLLVRYDAARSLAAALSEKRGQGRRSPAAHAGEQDPQGLQQDRREHQGRPQGKRRRRLGDRRRPRRRRPLHGRAGAGLDEGQTARQPESQGRPGRGVEGQGREAEGGSEKALSEIK